MSLTIEKPLSVRYTDFEHGIEKLSSVRRNTKEYDKAFKQVHDDANLLQKQISQLNLFSGNEAVDEIQSSHLRYLGLDYLVAKLFENQGGLDTRLQSLRLSNKNYLKFLNTCDDLEILDKKQSKLCEALNDDLSLESFEAGSGLKNAVNRREFKIENYKMEKALTASLKKLKIDDNDENAAISVGGMDDETVRSLYLDQLKLYILKSVQSLESNLMEVEMLKNMPPRPTGPSQTSQSEHHEKQDERQKKKNVFTDSFTTKLEVNPNTISKKDLLSKEGKVLQPFTIVSSRQQLQNKVQGTGQVLPTMSIEELVDQELANGGMVKPQEPEPEVDEDDMDAADKETYKKRDWDLFTEANPRGSGNSKANLG
ncbi:unnamed protein product [Ambrosiozyma monospora]|uniref:Unnamed protein product n=1 Tax=Ambrosiozyma monospora TaxID=43982 RepID=A0A9W7DFD5_AMBMO|nr:unnamed protein product [Ambrosiozyma monospora]